MKNLFFGGIHPKYQKEMSTAVTEFIRLDPDILVIPMVQHIGAPCTPLVLCDHRKRSAEYTENALFAYSFLCTLG